MHQLENQFLFLKVCPDTVCGDGSLGNDIMLPDATPNTCTGFSVGTATANQATPVLTKNCNMDKIRIDGAKHTHSISLIVSINY